MVSASLHSVFDHLDGQTDELLQVLVDDARQPTVSATAFARGRP